jgi:hypothetical protein
MHWPVWPRGLQRLHLLHSTASSEILTAVSLVLLPDEMADPDQDQPISAATVAALDFRSIDG